LPTINYMAFDGTVRAADAPDGQSVMQTARENDIEGIVAICGGNMMCGTCHVVVDDAWTDRAGPPSDDEAAVLEALDARADVRPSSRLACQIKMSPELDGLSVYLPRYQPGV
jgi:ferredoxin, 2Fe-2S